MVKIILSSEEIKEIKKSVYEICGIIPKDEDIDEWIKRQEDHLNEAIYNRLIDFLCNK